ncbi:MAG TPA: Hsp20/alpha crystallin family protein [Burkholderiales bacterium]|nr:Hsp20/alpha crystallin family protein [Burkholderiales bacterium]
MAKQSRRRNTQTSRAENSGSNGNSQKQSRQKQTTAINPFEPMGRVMQAFMPFQWMNPWMTAMDEPTPKLDLIDREDLVIVRAQVPGVQKSHLEVEASDTMVTIKGEIKQEDTREEERYRIAEMRRGAFERSVRLPAEVDSTRAKASFKDGVLEVSLPKVDRSRPHQVKF